jgi:hypothetical protein
VADRVGPEAGETVNVAVPGPVVLVPPPVTVIQSTLLTADHVQPAVVVTPTFPVPPSGPVWYAVEVRV